MSALSVNDVAVLGGALRLPRRGAWVADLTLDGTEVPKAPLTIANVDGSLKLTGRIERADVFADTVRVLAVAGKGSLDTKLPAKAYRNAPARLVLNDILKGAGETLASASSSKVLSRQLPHWTRQEGPAALALAALLEKVGATWRFLPDGTLWVGDTETWPAAPEGQYTLVDDDRARERVLLAVESPRLVPGTTFEGRRISTVVHTIEATGITSELWFEADADAADGAIDPSFPRLLGAFRRLLARSFARVDYFAPWRCKVVSQNGDGTLELRPDSPKLPPLSSVPMKVPSPGIKISVSAGAFCYVHFDGGDPSKPHVHGWEYDGLTEIQIGGKAPIARQGDLVSTSLPPGYTFTCMIAGLLGTAPGAPISPGPAVLTVTMAPLPLAGLVVTGSGKAKA